MNNDDLIVVCFITVLLSLPYRIKLYSLLVLSHDFFYMR